MVEKLPFEKEDYMKTISYKFCDGTINVVEVSDELAVEIAKMERETKNNDRCETRRHTSLDQASEREDTEIADESVNIEEDIIQNIELSKLHTAIKTLTPEQQELIRKVFFEEKTTIVIAKEYGISRQAVQNRLRKIYANLRKKIEEKIS